MAVTYIPMQFINGQHKVTVQQGAEYRVSLSVDRDLTGATIRASARHLFDDASTYFDFTVENRVDGATSTFDLVLDASVTAALDVPAGITDTTSRSRTVGNWDLEFDFGSNEVDRPMFGPVDLSLEATK